MPASAEVEPEASEDHGKEKKMTKLDLLNEYFDREMNTVFCYSANYLMTIPKKGYEQEWNQAKEKAEILEGMIKEAAAEEASFRRGV